MSSLYKSTDPFVRSLLRDVEGQIRSYRSDHQDAAITDRAVRSIAKRVTGQIVSQWARLSDMRATYLVRMSEATVGDTPSPPSAAGVPCTSAPAADLVEGDASDG